MRVQEYLMDLELEEDLMELKAEQAIEGVIE